MSTKILILICWRCTYLSFCRNLCSIYWRRAMCLKSSSLFFITWAVRVTTQVTMSGLSKARCSAIACVQCLNFRALRVKILWMLCEFWQTHHFSISFFYWYLWIVICSTCRPYSYGCFHNFAAEWRKKFWCSLKQTVYSTSGYWCSDFHRNACRFTHLGTLTFICTF